MWSCSPSCRWPKQGGIGFDAELLEDVKGITFRPAGDAQITRTAARVRMKDPNTIPSPYLQGLFDGYDGRVEAAIIESNRGCPFGCTFCDWGSATNQKVRKYDMDRAKAEIDWIGQNTRSESSGLLMQTLASMIAILNCLNTLPNAKSAMVIPRKWW